MTVRKIIFALLFTGLPARAQSQALNGLGLMFERNIGQMDGAVNFVARTSGYTLLLTQKGAIFRTPHTALKMDLIGARADSSPVGVGTLETRVHYLLGNNPDGWHTNVPVYSRVEYRNVY